MHLHLYYEDASLHILNRLSKVWNDVVYISLIKNSCSNEIILKYAQGYFKEIRWVEVDNKGTDQYGFIFTHQMNNEKYKPWTLYLHDKSSDKRDWLDDMMDIFIEDKYQKILDKHMNSKNIGIIGAKSRKSKLLDSDELIEETKHLPFQNRGIFIGSIGTLAWMRELQNIFYNKKGIIKEEFLNPYFVAGTVFMARKSIIDNVHSCVHKNFFYDGYRPDGEVEHAMERFYFYVSEAIGYKNVFI